MAPLYWDPNKNSNSIDIYYTICVIWILWETNAQMELVVQDIYWGKHLWRVGVSRESLKTAVTVWLLLMKRGKEVSWRKSLRCSTTLRKLQSWSWETSSIFSPLEESLIRHQWASIIILVDPVFGWEKPRRMRVFDCFYYLFSLLTITSWPHISSKF